MSKRLMLLTAACVGVGAIAFAPVVRGSPVTVNLVPDNPGPYFGGESLTIDIWLQSNFDQDVLLRIVQFDFGASDSALNLAPVFEFDHSGLISKPNFYPNFTLPELPAPFTAMLNACICPGSFILLESGDNLHIGSLGATLPMGEGQYELDALNVEEDRYEWSEYGAAIETAAEKGFPGEQWLAHEGDLDGGRFEFVVVPEPGTLLLMCGACVMLFAGRRGANAYGRDVGPVAKYIGVLQR